MFSSLRAIYDVACEHSRLFSPQSTFRGEMWPLPAKRTLLRGAREDGYSQAIYDVMTSIKRLA